MGIEIKSNDSPHDGYYLYDLEIKSNFYPVGLIKKAVHQERLSCLKIAEGKVCQGHTEPRGFLEIRCEYCDRVWNIIQDIRKRNEKEK